MKTESVSIRYVTDKDKAFWFRHDRHLPESEFDRKVRDQQGYHFPEKKIDKFEKSGIITFRTCEKEK